MTRPIVTTRPGSAPIASEEGDLVFPADHLWTDHSPAASVLLISNTDPAIPVMHMWWGGSPDADGQWIYHTACGLKTTKPTRLRYDHARRIAAHCQRCTRHAYKHAR